ncbi:Maestro heat-like repeat-containing protein family member 7, partial [Varanus komodoensis]
TPEEAQSSPVPLAPCTPVELGQVHQQGASLVSPQVFGVYFSPREKTDFILTALDGLTEHCSSTCCATTEGLLASIARNCGAEIEKVSATSQVSPKTMGEGLLPSKLPGPPFQVSDIVDGICSRLDLIHQSSARRLVMKLVGVLAGKTEHLDTVISSLLEHSFPTDSSSSELWQSLSTEEVVEEQLMENLLARLKKHHSSEPQASPASIAIMHALYEVISVPESRDTIQRLYPEVLTSFLVELHFSTQAEALPEAKPFSKWYGPGGSLTSFTVETIKLLLLRMGCRYEATFMEKTRGWAMLQSAGELLQGATLLARAMLHFSCPETTRILDFLFSQLGKGSETLKPTTIAFFVELLHCQEIEQLPAEQLCESLAAWTRSPSPDVRSLGLRALGILAIHPDKVEDVKALMPTLLASLEEADGGVLREGLTAVQNLLKFMQRSDVVSLAEKLLPLFNNVDAKARCVSIALFAELPNVVKKKERYLIQEQVTQSLVPLLLHLQDEEPEVAKACQEALARCFRFLGWALPKKVGSKKAWHDHPQIAETLCRQIAWKVKAIPAVLLQCLDHLQCPQVSIRRAAAIFIGERGRGALAGCIAQCTEPAAITKEKEELILLSLAKLKQDPDASVRLTAWHAIQMVQEASGGPYASPGGHIPPQQFGSPQREGGLCERGHWSTSDPSLTHRWNPASPVSHRIVASTAKRRLSGPGRPA